MAVLSPHGGCSTKTSLKQNQRQMIRLGLSPTCNAFAYGICRMATVYIGDSLDLTKWVPESLGRCLSPLNRFLPCLKQMVCCSFAPFQIAFVMFAVYTLVDNTHVLDAQKAFVSLTLINILNSAHSFLPFSINAAVQVNCGLHSFYFGHKCFFADHH